MKLSILKRNFFRYFFIFMLTICLFVVALTLVYTIPQKFIEPHINDSINIIENEGHYPRPFFGGSESCMLDNFTDELMLKECIVKSNNYNALQAAMYQNNYTRYWHGYQIILRPLLVLTSYRTIRYINTFIILGLTCLNFSAINKKLGLKSAIAFFISINIVCLFIIPMSMQYMTSFTVMLLSAYIFLKKYDPMDPQKFSTGLLFFFTGMFVNFIDFLTYPIITLGMPLLILISLNLNYNNHITIKTNLKYILKYSALWALGYGMCWFSKWAISSAILRENVFKDAMNTIIFRTSGNEEYQLNRMQMLKDNISNLLVVHSKFIYMLIICICILLLMIFLVYKKPANYIKQSMLFLVIGTLPYIWDLCLANHSQIHAWFTYRNQMVTVFSLLLAYIHIIDWKKFFYKFHYLKRGM